MEKRLFLIDGHALVFKMYYAFLRHPMINSKGADMSILFGFTKYLLELIEKERPTHLAVAFDPPGGTFRHEMFPEYKGTRDATPQLVIDSLEPLCELCQAMGFPVLMKKGYEADDVIGSMAKQAEKDGFTVYMVTPDKDYGQLISETNSLSVVGGLLLGDFAVTVGWLSPDVILYMAFVAISNFTQSSYELGYAFKYMRMLILLLTAVFNLWGYIAGWVITLVLVSTNVTVNGKRNYLYPLIPFNGKALLRLLIRVKKHD